MPSYHQLLVYITNHFSGAGKATGEGVCV